MSKLVFFLVREWRQVLRDFYEVDTMGFVGHGLYHRPRQEDARSGATRMLPPSWATPHSLGLL